MSHVFLSYSRRDTEFMHRLREDLQASGLDVWTDETGLEPGTPAWEAAIQQAIEGAGCLVVILSPDAKDSLWVTREMSYAEEHKLRIFPVLARGDGRSAVPIRLTSTQRVDARNDYAGALHELMDSLRNLLGLAAATDPVEMLPVSLRSAMDSPLAGVREGAVSELAHLLDGSLPAIAQAARVALEQLTHDDSRNVSTAASDVLNSSAAAPPPPTPAPARPTASPSPASRPVRKSPRMKVGPLVGVLVALAVVVVIVVVLGTGLPGGNTPTGDGPDDVTENTPSGEEPEAAPASEEPEAGQEEAAADSLAQALSEHGVIVVGVHDTGSWPFSLVDEQGNYSGFEIDLAEEIVERLFDGQVRIEWLGVSAAQRFEALQSGEIDMLLRNTTHTTSRADDLGIEFTSNYFLDGMRVMVALDSGISDLPDLEGATISMVSGTTFETVVENTFSTRGITFNPLVFNSYTEAHAALLAGQADALIGDWSTLLAYYYADGGPPFYVIGPVFDKVTYDSSEGRLEAGHEPFAIGLPPGQTDFRDEVDAVLLQIISDGTWQEFYDRWFPDTHPWTLDEMLDEPPLNR